jgi:hypothetical protein
MPGASPPEVSTPIFLNFFSMVFTPYSFRIAGNSPYIVPNNCSTFAAGIQEEDAKNADAAPGYGGFFCRNRRNPPGRRIPG